MSEKAKRVALSERELETELGDQLAEKLDEFSGGTLTLKEILDLKLYLEFLCSRVNFPAIQFLLDEISKSTVTGKISIRGRLDLVKAVERVLKYPKDSEPWTHQKPTPRQIERIEWWMQKIGEPSTTLKNKQEAHDAIEWLKAENPNLEEIWHKERDQRRNAEAVLLNSTFWKDELDEVYNFDAFIEPDSPISDPFIYGIFKNIDWKRPNESENDLMQRFFAELQRQRPNLFKSKSARRLTTNAKSNNRGCLVSVAILFIFAVILFVVSLIV